MDLTEALPIFVSGVFSNGVADCLVFVAPSGEIESRYSRDTKGERFKSRSHGRRLFAVGQHRIGTEGL